VNRLETYVFQPFSDTESTQQNEHLYHFYKFSLYGDCTAFSFVQKDWQELQISIQLCTSKIYGVSKLDKQNGQINNLLDTLMSEGCSKRFAPHYFLQSLTKIEKCEVLKA
jgi:hypothetical protein